MGNAIARWLTLWIAIFILSFLFGYFIIGGLFHG
jgi:hypothetical protein